METVSESTGRGSRQDFRLSNCFHDSIPNTILRTARWLGRANNALLVLGILFGGVTTAYASGLARLSETQPLREADRKALSLVVNSGLKDRATPKPQFATPAEHAHWVGAVARQLEARIPDRAIRTKFLDTAYYEAQRAGLDPYLVLAVVDASSGFNVRAESSTGARGLMQVPSHWAELLGSAGTDLFDMRINLRYGCTILRHYLDESGGNLYAALGKFHGSENITDFRGGVRSAWTKWKNSSL